MIGFVFLDSCEDSTALLYTVSSGARDEASTVGPYFRLGFGSRSLRPDPGAARSRSPTQKAPKSDLTRRRRSKAAPKAALRLAYSDSEKRHSPEAGGNVALYKGRPHIPDASASFFIFIKKPTVLNPAYYSVFRKLHWYEVHTRETTDVDPTTHDEPASVTYMRT